MIFTVLLDIPTNLFLGQLMAWTARRQIAGAQPFTPFNRWFWRAMTYALLFFLPVTGYYYYTYPDWSFVYFVRPEQLPDWLGTFVLLSYAGGMFYGFLAGQAFIRAGRPGLALAGAVYALLLTLVAFFATADQYLHVGTYEQYQAGQAPSLFSDECTPFRNELNLLGAFLVIPAVGILLANHLEGRGATDEQDGMASQDRPAE